MYAFFSVQMPKLILKPVFCSKCLKGGHTHNDPQCPLFLDPQKVVFYY